MVRIRFRAAAVLASIAVIFNCGRSIAGTITAGNILASSRGDVYEFTPTGKLVQTIPVPNIDGDARDIIMHPNGDLLVFNGTFNPRMSTYDQVTDSWTSQAFQGLSTVNNVSYGGIATDGRYVYMSDNSTAGVGSPAGVVRFDRQGGPTIRSVAPIQAIDLTLGLDGLLYTLNGTGSPAGTSVSVYDPVTLKNIRGMSLRHVSSRNTGIAVDYDGSVFVATWGGELKHIAPNGSVLNSIELPTANSQLPANNNFDVDIHPDGSILVGHRFGSVVRTDRSLSEATAFLVPTRSNVFVSFAVPEPSSFSLLSSAAVFLALMWRRS